MSGGLAHFAGNRVTLEPMPATDGDIRANDLSTISQAFNSVKAKPQPLATFLERQAEAWVADFGMVIIDPKRDRSGSRDPISLLFAAAERDSGNVAASEL